METKRGNKRNKKKVKAAKCKSSNKIFPFYTNLLYLVKKTTLKDQRER